MTFAPEWLSGSPNLDTSNFMYLWVFTDPNQMIPMLIIYSYVYLIFFNVLWVFLPLFAMYESYSSLTGASPVGKAIESAKELKNKKSTWVDGENLVQRRLWNWSDIIPFCAFGWCNGFQTVSAWCFEECWSFFCATIWILEIWADQRDGACQWHRGLRAWCLVNSSWCRPSSRPLPIFNFDNTIGFSKS